MSHPAAPPPPARDLPQSGFLFDAADQRIEHAPGIWLTRHWHNEGPHAWSRAMRAVVTFDAQLYPAATGLIIELAVYGASPRHPRTLHIHSADHPTQTLTISTDTPVSLRVTTSAPQTRHRAGTATAASAITFELDRLTSPARQGVSRDTRLLGLQILSVRADQHALALPADLTTTPEAACLLAGGWAPLEPGIGAWSTGTRSDLQIPGYLRPPTPAQTPPTLVLHAHALPRPADHPPLELCIETPAGMGAWHTITQTELALPFTAEQWENNTAYVVTLHARHMASPEDLGINADPRSLGILLRGIAVQSPA